MYINFQPNRVSRSVKTVHTNLFAKFANCINLQLAIRISKNHAFRTCTTPSRTFRPILRSIGLIDNELPRKEIISTDGRTDGRTDGQTDGRTDGQTSRTTTIGSFFRKKKKLLKNNHKFKHIAVNTSQYRQSFFPKTVGSWNQLSFADSPTLENFRINLLSTNRL